MTNTTEQVVRNPGVVPDSRFASANTDITVVFEESWQVWQARNASVASLPRARHAYSLMLNSVPVDTMSNATLGGLLNNMSSTAEYLFVTSKTENFYESFQPDWLRFVGLSPGNGTNGTS
jgi:hypothetical protein